MAPPKKEKESAVDLHMQVDKKTKEGEKIFKEINHIQKKLEGVRKVQYKLITNNEFQELLLEAKVDLQQKIEAIQKECQETGKQTWEVDPVNYSIFLLEEKQRLGIWIVTTTNGLNKHENSVKVSEKIKQIITKEDLSMEWQDLVPLVCNKENFEKFIQEGKKAMLELKSKHQEKLDAIVVYKNNQH